MSTLIQSMRLHIAALFLWLALLPSAAISAPVRIAYAAIASNTAGVWMAEGTGAFKNQGLDVQFIYISSSATNVQALLSGSIDVMVGGASGIVSAAARGAPLVAIGSQMNRAPATLYVQPEITEASQLKGATLGISRPNSSTHVLTALVLRKLGLENAATLRSFATFREFTRPSIESSLPVWSARSRRRHRIARWQTPLKWTFPTP